MAVGVSAFCSGAEKEDDKKNGNMIRSERYYGQQYCSFALPQEVDDTKAEAKYQDGMLD